jgi:hypothetical protein
MYTASGDIRMQTAAGNIETKVTGNYNIEITDSFDVNIGSTAKMLSGSSFNVRSGSALNMQSTATTNINAGGDIIGTGSAIHLNGPPAATAEAAGTAEDTYWTNRKPDHEPWARVVATSADSNTNHDSWSDEENNDRNEYWRR